MSGGIIRIASKIPGISAVKSAFGLSPAVPPAEQSLRTALWEGSRGSSADAFPRVVFSGPPTCKEAKEATSELKDALEKVYLFSNNSGTDDSTPAAQFSGLSLISSSCSEPKPTLASKAVAAGYSEPSHAVQALKLLSQSRDAQSVVASIATDPKVFDAVLQNNAFMDYVQSQKASSEFPSEASGFEEASDDNTSMKGSNGTFFENLEHSILSVFQNIKLSVVGMVSNISGYLRNIFSPPGGDKNIAEDKNIFSPPGGYKNIAEDANTGSQPVEETWGVTFMRLGILVVMIVLLKRV